MTYAVSGICTALPRTLKMPNFYNAGLLPIQWCSEKIQAWAPGYTLMKIFSSQSVGALALAAQAVDVVEAKNSFDVFKYVDPLIGTSNGGENQKPSELVAQLTPFFRSRVSWGYSPIW
jgi:hypothetical protein